MIFAGYRYDVFELLYAADLFLFPSHREGLGIAALEAMSAGLPLVASNIRGVTEYAVDQKNSLLFAPDDVEVTKKTKIKMSLFHAVMETGVILIPPYDSPEVLKGEGLC